MKTLLFITIFLFHLCPVLGKNASGILSLVDQVQEIRVGQFYRYKLILFPFEQRELEGFEVFKNPFLDLFSISQVSDIYVSSENADALIVELDMALSKYVELKEVYIFPLGEKNIPIEIRLPKVENTELVQKDFRVLEKDFHFKENSQLVTMVFLITIILGLVFLTFFFWWKKRKVKIGSDRDPLREILLVMEKAEKHKDLEEIYLKRGLLEKLAKETGKSSQLNSFLQAFSKNQYRPDWRSVDVNDLTKEARELAKELSRGI